MTAEIYYGGRITDPVDQRLLTSLLKRCLNATQLETNFQKDTLKQYVLPSDYSYHDIREFVMSLPVDPPPDVLGLDSGTAVV